MELSFDELSARTRRINLAGRLDLKGTGEIDMRFTGLTSTDANDVVVDMGGVEFIASIGMRLLLTCAKAKAQRGGKLALYGLHPLVKEALETAGIDNLIPLYDDEAAAVAGLAA